MNNTYKLKLLEKIVITDNLYIFRFSYPSKNFSFEPGQFVSVKVNNKDKRFYSIASSSSNKKYLEFLITTTPGGVGSKFFENIKIGDIAEFAGPFGHFVYQKSKGNIYFIATGTGLAPLISMIRELLLNKKNQNQLTLIYGVRYQDQIAYKDLLKDLKDTYNNFNYIITLSRPSDSWNGHKGYVTDIIRSYKLFKLDDFYICGGKNMVLDTKKILSKKGIQPKNIHFELY